MSIISNIKKGVASSGSNKGQIVFIKAGAKVRLRFLQDMEDGVEVTMHDSFDKGINALCQKHVDRKCPYCDDETLRTRQAYAWSVWDYDAKEVKIFLGYANSFNPLPSLVGMFEAYGTIMDRDYVISRNGSGTGTTYGVVPMDKVKFKNPKAKPLTESKLIDVLDKAYPVNEDDAVGNKNGKKKPKKQEEPEVDEDDEDEDENDYASMSAKELYMECVERGIKGVKKKQKPKYYIELLEDDDDNGDDWEDSDEDDDDSEW